MFYDNEGPQESSIETVFALTKDTGSGSEGNVVLAEDIDHPETGSPVWVPVDMARNKGYRVFLFESDNLRAEDVKAVLAEMVRQWGPNSIMNGNAQDNGAVLFFTGVDVETIPAQRIVRW